MFMHASIADQNPNLCYRSGPTKYLELWAMQMLMVSLC